MDHADAQHRFTDVPYVIEAPAAAGGLATAAARALAGVRVTLDPKGITTERYRELLAAFRGDIKGRLPTGPYRIDALDRTADDLKAEGRRVDRNLVGYADALQGRKAEGAFSGPYQARDGGKGCVITGFPPGYDIATRLSRPVGGTKVDTGGLDAESFHWFAFRHELGHCLLGASEARAETFSALMALRDGRLGRGQLAALARYREADEWTHPEADDGHFVSAALWEVVRRSDALRANPRFMAMTVEEVAATARAAADRFGLTQAEADEARAVRKALKAVQGPGFRAWLSANPAEPVLARAARALDALERGGPVPPRYRIDAKGFTEGLAAMAARGDANAGRVLAAYVAPATRWGTPPDFAAGIPLARRNPGLDVAAMPQDAEEAVAAPAPR